jgi:hypothetical protein
MRPKVANKKTPQPVSSDFKSFIIVINLLTATGFLPRPGGREWERTACLLPEKQYL